MAPFLILSGFMGSGKTSVGRAAAALLGWAFVDLDAEFVEREGDIAGYFARQGENGFRERESRLLREVLHRQAVGRGTVIALGGGTLESPHAMEMLAGRGGLVLLDVDIERAWQRARGTGRPLATERGAFEALYRRRLERYEEAADWVVPAGDRTVEDLAEEVVRLMSEAGEHWPVLWGRRLSGTERSSLIVGGSGALSLLGERARAARERGSRLFIITDANVLRAWGDEAHRLAGGDESCSVLVVAPGETSKNVKTLERCWDWLAEGGARRDDVVVALGGGVVGDLAGFAAATYQRGVSLWQVPTSLLAQVDSSVGGKTAVNLAAGKNLVGAFYQADLVLADPKVLVTLPEAEYVSGLGEVVKHALLVSAEALASLEGQVERVIARDADVVGGLVKMSVRYKAGVVATDERESGRRAVLNLGHTLAHALEVVRGYGALSHGQAVSLGLLVALAVSERCLGLDPDVRNRTERLLVRLGLPTRLSLPPVDSLLAAVAHDKKAKAGSIGFVGLRALGDAVWGLDVPRAEIERSLEVIRA